jgi:hypothetical protein
MCTVPVLKKTFLLYNRAGAVSGNCQRAGTRNSIESRTQTNGLTLPHITCCRLEWALEVTCLNNPMSLISKELNQRENVSHISYNSLHTKTFLQVSTVKI